MHHIFRTIIFLIFFVSSTAFSYKDYNEESFNPSFLSRLLNSEAILHIDEYKDRIYLKSEAIVFTEQGLFVKTSSGEYIEIPCLMSSPQGCYTVLSQTNSTVYPLIRCKNCNLPFNPNIFNKGKCPRCGTQN